ncbi:helix-turn-helix domain-containing protein [Lapidilactobacillus mulanensis]|uniref:Helix-turn-helix domain-containing protein n=2 Tax=Lactobacillaceae TaxID=33958 RepID=A0ABW4DR54_9LACO|nr:MULTISPECIES: helix-turn-helix domain-containing protein [Lactobacillaceae]
MKEDNLVPIIRAAQNGDRFAMADLLMRFDYLCIRQAKYGHGYFNEDYYQDLKEHLIVVIYKFNVDQHLNK